MIYHTVEARRERLHELVEPAYASLVSEFTRAALSGQDIEIPAPAFFIEGRPGSAVRRFSEVIADDVSGDSLVLRELLSIVGMAARGEDASLRALVWVARTAKAYAEYHCDDFVCLLEEGHGEREEALT